MRRVGVNTYYPPGTVCYRDPSQGKVHPPLVSHHGLLSLASCVDFGSSGSGVVREAIPYKVNDDGTVDPKGDRSV